MKKMNVSDAAEYFGVSKEAIHNRIRRGSLESVVEDGVKMVLVGAKVKKTTRTAVHVKSNDERYYKLLEEQNTKLQTRVETLEGETRSLRDQKELMLIEERKKIERIYKEKDEQLKNILSTISSQFMLSSPEAQEELVEAEIEEEVTSTLISLKKHLKQQNYSKEKAKKIKQKFKKKASKDERVIELDGKFYIDLAKYDYKGLL